MQDQIIYHFSKRIATIVNKVTNKKDNRRTKIKMNITDIHTEEYLNALAENMASRLSTGEVSTASVDAPKFDLPTVGEIKKTGTKEIDSICEELGLDIDGKSLSAKRSLLVAIREVMDGDVPKKQSLEKVYDALGVSPSGTAEQLAEGLLG